MRKNKFTVITAVLLCMLAIESAGASPILQLRLRAPDITSDEAWNATREMIAANPGCCDEVWFSTGIGVPVLFGIGRSSGNLKKEDAALSRLYTPSKKIQELRNSLDDCAGGMPAKVASPFVGLMLPRVSKTDGTLRNVALMNTRIGAQEQIELVLRGVPEGARATWYEMSQPPVNVQLIRNGSIVGVTIPSIGPWNAGYLEVKHD